MAKRTPTVTPYPYLDRPRWVSWQTSGGACQRCQANADVGIVPIDYVFPDGSTAPPAHEHCECGLQSEDPDYDQWQDESYGPDDMPDTNAQAGDNDTPTTQGKVTFTKTIELNKQPTPIQIVRTK